MRYLYDYAAAPSSCLCPECDSEFTSTNVCSKAVCPDCGHQGCEDTTEGNDSEDKAMWDAFVSSIPADVTLKLHPFHVVEEQAVVVLEGKKWGIRSASTGDLIGKFATKDEALLGLYIIQLFVSATLGEEEVAKSQCDCNSCGAIFWSRTRCDQSVCPVCNEQDDISELTGIL